MSVSLESILALIGNNLKDEKTRKRFQAFFESEITEPEKLRHYFKECIEKGGKSGREYSNALQDIVISIGKKLAFEVEYGPYSGSRNVEIISYDGLWKKESGEYLLLEVKSSPWPVTSISEQLGRYLDEFSKKNKISPTKIFGLYVIGPGDSHAIVDQIKGSEYRNRIRLISFDDLLKLVSLVDDLDTIGGPGSGGPKVQNILLPFESVNVGDFIDLVTEIAALKETSAEVVEESEKEKKEDKVWEKDSLIKYLEESTPYQKAFLAVLAMTNESEESLPKKLVLQRMQRVATLIPEIADDKKFTGYTIAGVRAGFKMRRDRSGMEDIIDEKHHYYKIKQNYKSVVKDWINSQKLTVPPIEQE